MPNFQFKKNQYRFTPTLIPTLATLFLFSGLISLGIWQLNRAEQKKVIDKGVIDATNSPKINLNTWHDKPLTSMTYHTAMLTGQFDNQHQLLLDNRTYKGKAGYMVLTPFLLDSNAQSNHPKAILINRGWIPYQGDRNNIPDIEVTNKTITVTGMIKNIGKSIVLNRSKQQTKDHYPKTIQAISTTEISSLLGYELLPVMIELDKQDKNGFVRDWQPYYGSVDKHIAYAVQWFAMAIVLLFLFFKMNTKKVE